MNEIIRVENGKIVHLSDRPEHKYILKKAYAGLENSYRYLYPNDKQDEKRI